MTERDWTQTDVSGDPRLLLGHRKSSKKIEVHRVDIHQDLFEDLRSIAQAAIAEVGRRDARPYSTFASKTGDDYFDVDVSDIPQRRDRRKKEDDPEAWEIAFGILRHLVGVDELHGDHLRLRHRSENQLLPYDRRGAVP